MREDADDFAFWANQAFARKAGGAVLADQYEDPGNRPLALAGFAIKSDLAFLKRQPFWPRIARCQTFLLPRSLDSNALALRRGPRQAIFLHGGLLLNLWHALWMIVAQSKVLADQFGWEVLPSHKIIDADVRNPAMFSDQHLGRLSRQGYLQELFGRAVEFIFFHEIAHHGRRHLDRLYGPAGLQVIDEAMNMASAGAEMSELSRLLEFDADWIASEMCLNATAHTRQDNGQTAGFQDRDHMTSELALHALAQSTLFMVLDQGRRAAPLSYNDAHPPALHRAVRVTKGLGDTIQKAAGMTRDEIGAFMNQAWAEVVIQAERMGYPPGIWNDRIEDLTRIDQLEKIADRANALTRALSAELSDERAGGLSDD